MGCTAARTALGAAAIAWATTATDGWAGVVPAGRSESAGTGAVRIAELRVDQQGADTDEYLELLGAPGASLAGCWFLAIGDGASDPGGVVELALDLSSWTFGPNGRFVAHEATFGTGVLGGRTLSIDAGASHATVGSGDSLNFENADSVTYLIVRSFTGSVGMDLDPGNDGTLDATPWSELVDAIAFVSSASTDPVYADIRVGPAAITATGGMPPHAWLDGDQWRIGEYASWSADTPGGAPAVPAPGAAAGLVAAAFTARSGLRRRR